MKIYLAHGRGGSQHSKEIFHLARTAKRASRYLTPSPPNQIHTPPRDSTAAPTRRAQHSVREVGIEHAEPAP